MPTLRSRARSTPFRKLDKLGFSGARDPCASFQTKKVLLHAAFSQWLWMLCSLSGLDHGIPWSPSWLGHGCSVLRTGWTMDVIMGGPWMLCTQRAQTLRDPRSWASPNMRRASRSACASAFCERRSSSLAGVHDVGGYNNCNNEYYNNSNF